MNKLRECRIQFFLFLLLDNLVVELDSVGVEDGIANFVPYALFLQVGDKGVLNLVPVCG